MTTEERLSRLEGAYEQVDRRLGDLTQAVRFLGGDVNSFRRSGYLVEARQEGVALHTIPARAASNHEDRSLRLTAAMDRRFKAFTVFVVVAWLATNGLLIGLYLQS